MKHFFPGIHRILIGNFAILHIRSTGKQLCNLLFYFFLHRKYLIFLRCKPIRRHGADRYREHQRTYKHAGQQTAHSYLFFLIPTDRSQQDQADNGSGKSCKIRSFPHEKSEHNPTGFQDICPMCNNHSSTACSIMNHITDFFIMIDFFCYQLFHIPEPLLQLICMHICHPKQHNRKNHKEQHISNMPQPFFLKPLTTYGIPYAASCSHCSTKYKHPGRKLQHWK